MNNFKTIVLVLSGLALLYASSSRLINPTDAVFLQSFFENPENSLETAIDLVNEIRGIGAVLFLGGIVALFGALRTDFSPTSFVVTTVIFGGIVLGRAVSFFGDGIPHPDLMRVAMIEAIIGALNIFCLANILRQDNRRS